MPSDPVDAYLLGGRVAWSPGYKQYRMMALERVVRDRALLSAFAEASGLPDGYGLGLDERVVEYPWTLARLESGPGRVLDAGSTLNYPYLLALPQLQQKTLVIVTLAPESTMVRQANVSYLFGDLRELVLRDSTFDQIVCISTLEHVGLDNTKLYTDNLAYRESALGGYREALREFRRVLRPGGTLLLTVPFGRAQDLGWLQQFDTDGLRRVEHAFGGVPRERTFFRYALGGWTFAAEEDCAQCEYFDVHSALGPAHDGAAAARAVACLVLQKA